MTNQRKYEFDPDYQVPPGETLREVMNSKNMSITELRKRTGLTDQSIIRIIKGEQPITYDSANALEMATGIPARLWNNLEAEYREQLSKAELRELYRQDLDWLKEIPVSDLIKRGHVEKTSDKADMVKQALAFFGFNSVAAWHENWLNPQVAARRSECFETMPGAAAVWIRMGELKAHEIHCEPYDKERFKDALKQIRLLTPKSPQVFEPEMIRLCAGAGVALAFVPEMKKVPWNGATKWLAPKKAMIILSLRGKMEDKFWFSFFHEAGHVLNDNKSNLYIADNSKSAEEIKADKFAREFLIPGRYDNTIVNIRSKAEIVVLAKKLGIAPGIVAGRYRHLTERWNYFLGETRTFRWADRQ